MLLQMVPHIKVEEKEESYHTYARLTSRACEWFMSCKRMWLCVGSATNAASSITQMSAKRVSHTTRIWMKHTAVCDMTPREWVISHTYEWSISLCAMTRREWVISHTHEWSISLCDMGWLRLVGSLKLQFSLAQEPHKRDYILQKRPIILRSLLIVATPYQWQNSSERWTWCRMQNIVSFVGLFCKRDL